MNYVILLFRFLFQHKWKIISGVVLLFVFAFVLFPFKDLNDFASSKVSELTQKSVYVQFEDMHFQPLTATLSLDQLLVETREIENVVVQKISVTPAISALIKRQPGGRIQAEGLFKGDLDLQVKPLEKLESGSQKILVDLQAEKISLKEARQSFKVQFPLNGTVQLNLHLTTDTAFTEQPEGDINATIDQVEMSSARLFLPDLGALNLPDIKMKKIEVKGKLSNGKLTIDHINLGQNSDEFFGTIKGDLGLRLENRGGQIQPQIGSYNLNVELTAKPAFEERAHFFFNFIDGYKKSDAGGLHVYKFRLQARGDGMPPQFSPLD